MARKETLSVKESITPAIITGLGGLAFHLARRNRRHRQDIAELKKQAMEDPLTKLPNRRAFMDYYTGVLADGQRHKSPVSVLAIDIDRFKAINDTHGHPVGDKALVSVADLLQGNTRVGDYVARIGGEEFAVALPHTSPEDAMITAEKLREAVAANRLEHDGVAIPTTVSIGVASYDPNASTYVLTPDGLLTNADRALYDAKEAGRNQVMAFGTRPTAN